MRPRLAWLLGLLALAPLAPVAPAQVSEPAVSFEDVTYEPVVKPLGEPALVPLHATVGCVVDETPGTVTHVVFSAGDGPEFLRVAGTAGLRTWTTTAGACPDALSPHVVDVALVVSLTEAAPAFVPFSFPVEMTVRKNVTNGEPREYGPYTAEVTLTPGYFNLFNVRLDKRIASVGADEVAVFPIVIDNFSNGATRFTFSFADVRLGATLEYSPAELVLAPSEQGTVTVSVSYTGAGLLTNDIVATQLQIASASVDARGEPGASSQVSMLIQFRGDLVREPWPVVIVASAFALVAAVGFVAWRRWRG